MLWELDSLGAAAVVCDKETHGKVLGAAEGALWFPISLLSPGDLRLWAAQKILQQNGRIGLTACFGGCFTGLFY